MFSKRVFLLVLGVLALGTEANATTLLVFGANSDKVVEPLGVNESCVLRDKTNTSDFVANDRIALERTYGNLITTRSGIVLQPMACSSVPNWIVDLHNSRLWAVTSIGNKQNRSYSLIHMPVASFVSGMKSLSDRASFFAEAIAQKDASEPPPCGPKGCGQYHQIFLSKYHPRVLENLQLFAGLPLETVVVNAMRSLRGTPTKLNIATKSRLSNYCSEGTLSYELEAKPGQQWSLSCVRNDAIGSRKLRLDTKWFSYALSKKCNKLEFNITSDRGIQLISRTGEAPLAIYYDSKQELSFDSENCAMGQGGKTYEIYTSLGLGKTSPNTLQLTMNTQTPATHACMALEEIRTRVAPVVTESRIMRRNGERLKSVEIKISADVSSAAIRFSLIKVNSIKGCSSTSSNTVTCEKMDPATSINTILKAYAIESPLELCAKSN